MAITRRKVLWMGIGISATLLAGVGGLAVLRGSAPRVPGLRALSAQEYRTLAAVARTHLPAGGPIAPGADALHLARAFDTYLADEPDEVQADVRHALALLEFGPVLFERRAVTFSNLAAAEQLAHWKRWLESSSLMRRQIAWTLKKYLSLVFYDNPAVWPAIGYPGPSFARSAK